MPELTANDTSFAFLVQSVSREVTFSGFQYGTFRSLDQLLLPNKFYGRDM